MTAPTDTLQWGLLQARAKAKKLPHALLLTGVRGSGKNAFARHFAASLLCISPRVETGIACGQCSACKLVAAGSHADYTEVLPEEDSRVIKIDQIRVLCEQLGLTAQLGGYRVALISPADAMRAAAANSLLKTLEEPGPGVLIILVSSKQGAIPATIRSRCQRVRINGLGDRLSPDADPVSTDRHMSEWLAGLARERDYISIANDWSKTDHEAIFSQIFIWLKSAVRQSFAQNIGPPTDAITVDGTFVSETAKIQQQKLFSFYDKLLSAYQFAAVPGINRRALYEQLFVRAQAITQ